MLLDTSHCSLKTTLDACHFSEQPVCANHTCSAAVFAHPRNKSDLELRAIAETGGIIGVSMVPHYLSASANTSIADWLDHVTHIIDLVGWEHIGIGTDWPIQAPQGVFERTFGAMLNELGFLASSMPNTTLADFTDFRDFPSVCRGLVRRGYSDKQIAGILGGNFLRVFERVCG
jgi:membrane dipeptidase